MSAINYLKWRPNELHFFADGASYLSDGTLTHVSAKLHTLPHLPCVLATRGPAWAGAIIAAEVGQCFRTFDELIDNIEETLPLLFDKHSHTLLADTDLSNTEIYLGGWSQTRDEAVVYSIANHDRRPRAAAREHEIPEEIRVPMPDAYELLEMTGRAFIAPNLEGDALERALGDITIDKLTSLDTFFLAVLELQRERKLALFDGLPAAHFVGGHVQVVTLTKTDMRNRIIKRWPDEVAQVITPEPVDWAAWRAEHANERALVPEGLSRLQRERMQKKARKGTLRAVS